MMPAERKSLIYFSMASLRMTKVLQPSERLGCSRSRSKNNQKGGVAVEWQTELGAPKFVRRNLWEVGPTAGRGITEKTPVNYSSSRPVSVKNVVSAKYQPKE